MELNPGTLVVEGTLWLLGVLAYVRATQATSKFGICGLWVFISMPTLFWISMPFAPPPPGEFSHTLLAIALVLYALLIALTHWTDRNRTIRHELLSSQAAATGGNHE